MACVGCIARQRKLIQFLCKKPDSWPCQKAKARLEKMLAESKETK